MIVPDASVIVEILTGGPTAAAIERKVLGSGSQLIAPHLLDVEVVSAIRGLVAARRIDAGQGEEAIRMLSALRIVRYAHTPLMGRIWELRHNFTAYDAVYIALAETAGAEFCTCDLRLAKGHQAKTTVFR